MRILVDAMGGDNAPLEILKGCKLAASGSKGAIMDLNKLKDL